MKEYGVWGLCLSMLLASTSSYSYIYEVIVMRSWRRDTGSYQYIVGCSDYHDSTSAIGTGQRHELLEMFDDDTSKEQLSVLVEDLGSANESGYYRCGHLCLSSSKGVLASFTKACLGRSIDVHNIEYRYVRVIALAELVANPDRSPYESSPACSIRVGDLIGEVARTIEQIRYYQDSERLTTLYRVVYERVQKQLNQLALTNPDMSVASLCHAKASQSSMSSRIGFLKQLLTFDSRLLDCKLVHQVVNAQHKDKIVVIAGGIHIERMSQMLAQVGFERVKQVRSESKIGMSVAQALNVKTSRNVKRTKSAGQPKAIELEVVREYLEK